MSERSVHYTSCPLCEAVCGLEIHVSAGAIQRIQGDAEHVLSRGFICPKGASLKQLHEDPDRLRTPLIRAADGSFREASWSEAYALIQERLLPILKSHRDSVAVYLGNPTVHSVAGAFFPRALNRALGTRNVFSASTVDQMPKQVACGLMYGDPNAITVPDIDRTDYLLLLGANPWESNGSLCTAPGFPGRIKALLERGGRFVVVDPRRTRTAEHATEHVPIRPATDAHLLLGMLRVIVTEKLVRLGTLEPWVNGVEALAELVEPFNEQAVSAITGVPAETIRRLARELADTPRAVVYGRIGTHTVSFGTVAAWAVDALNAVTGHLDAPGGAMWPLAAHMRRGDGQPGKGFTIGRRTSRVGGHPEVKGELPVAILADEIETPGEGQVRALITVAGNPVLSTPHSARLDRALAGLEFMVSVDPYLNETTRHAHVILPPPSPLTRAHYDVAFTSLAVHNFAHWSEPLFDRAGPSEAEILARLVLVASGQDPNSEPNGVYALLEQFLLQSAIKDNPELTGKTPADLASELVGREPTERFVEILIRSGAYGDMFGAVSSGLSLTKLRQRPHGIDLGALEPRLPECLNTPSGKVELTPDLIRADLGRVVAVLTEPSRADCILIGRRDLRSNNSWMHNLPLLIKGRERCTLHIHPEHAARLGFDDGQAVQVSSSVGSVTAPIEITDSIMPGVVSLPHGYGHDASGARLSVARDHAGVNFNVLTDARALDPLSGNAVLNGIPVKLASQTASRG